MSGYSDAYSTHTGAAPYSSTPTASGVPSGTAPAQRGTYGDQAMSKTSRIATNLSHQAEQLKQKFGGPYQTTVTNHVAGQPYASTQYVAQPQHKPGIMDRAKQGIVGGINYSQQGLGYVAAKTHRPGMAQTTMTAPTQGGLGHNTAMPAAGQYSSQTTGYTSNVQNTGVPASGHYTNQTIMPSSGYGTTGMSGVGQNTGSQYTSQQTAGAPVGGYNTTGTSGFGQNTGTHVPGGQYSSQQVPSIQDSGYSGAGTAAHPGSGYNPWPSSAAGAASSMPGAMGYTAPGSTVSDSVTSSTQPSAGNHPGAQTTNQYGNAGSAYAQNQPGSGSGFDGPSSTAAGTAYPSGVAAIPASGQDTSYQQSGYTGPSTAGGPGFQPNTTSAQSGYSTSSAVGGSGYPSSTSGSQMPSQSASYQQPGYSNSNTAAGYQPNTIGSQLSGQTVSHQQLGYTNSNTAGGYQSNTNNSQMPGQAAGYQQPGSNPAAAEAAYSNSRFQGSSTNTSGQGYAAHTAGSPGSAHTSSPIGNQYGSNEAGSQGQLYNPSGAGISGGFSNLNLGSQTGVQGMTGMGASGTGYAPQTAGVTQSVGGPQAGFGGQPGIGDHTGYRNETGVQPTGGVVTVTSHTASPLVTNPVPGRLGENTPVFNEPASILPGSSYNAPGNTTADNVGIVPTSNAYGNGSSAEPRRNFPAPVEL
ncbi:hypothetical protein WJX74_010533 [Apatococcus lobatus]|uniref:Uncharacterized protein n=1 Tax=Apatococcus lobatus TaxID=904363 RepID=A0AAW1RI97_9CHLO